MSTSPSAAMPAAYPPNTLLGRHGPATRSYVWQLPVRLTHWLIFLSIVVLSVTGFYIGRPFIIASGPATQSFVMGTVKAVHFYSAMVFSLSLLIRFLWFFAGNDFASWREFLPVSRRRRREIVRVLKFYLFLTPELPPCGGHNALAGLTYTLVFALFILETLTGLALYAVGAHTASPMGIFAVFLPIFGGLQTARWIHHAIMWLLLGFAVHHVYSAVMVSIAEKNGTLESIFSGYKFCPTILQKDETEARRRLEK